MKPFLAQAILDSISCDVFLLFGLYMFSGWHWIIGSLAILAAIMGSESSVKRWRHLGVPYSDDL